MSASASQFSVLVQPSGRAFSVEPSETLLAGGIRQGVGLPYGCKDGACGSCKCKKISGTVVHGNHQDKALSAAEEAAGMVLTCCATATSDLVLESRQVSLEGALPVRKMPARISSLVHTSPDVIQLQLQLPASESFQYRAGQYLDVLLRDGARRSYSMANAPHRGPTLELHIRHMPGGRFTDLVFGSMKERDIVRIEGPMGSFFLREDSDKPVVLLASGTGFAPIKALIEHMQERQITRPATLFWGGRRPQDLYMDDWVRTQCSAMAHLSYVPVVSDALPEDNWQGRTGFVHQAVLEDIPDLSGYQVYACGAPVVVESAQRDFSHLAGLDEDEFFADAFTSEAVKH